MTKSPRYQSIISRQSDAPYSEDYWLHQFEKSLQKTSVQSRSKDKEIFEQISSIMNNGTQSKYHSVQDKVSDMMSRSGLTTYIENVKAAEKEETERQAKKTAQAIIKEIKQEGDIDKENDDKIPQAIQEKPSIARTLENLINESRGNMNVPAIISRLRSLHLRDVDDAVWDDEKLMRLVSRLNLQAKKNNPSNFDNFDQLGQGDHSLREDEIDASNRDAFNALLPAKF